MWRENEKGVKKKRMDRSHEGGATGEGGALGVMPLMVFAGDHAKKKKGSDILVRQVKAEPRAALCHRK